MPKTVIIRNVSRGDQVLLEARWCASFRCRLRGLTFRRRLKEGEGLLLVESGESRFGTAIHMFFMFMELGIAWVDRNSRVVDTVLARPWRIYSPASPAKFVIEGPVDLLEYLAVDDDLTFEEIDT